MKNDDAGLVSSIHRIIEVTGATAICSLQGMKPDTRSAHHG
jgi:hypothetical protein